MHSSAGREVRQFSNRVIQIKSKLPSENLGEKKAQCLAERKDAGGRKDYRHLETRGVWLLRKNAHE